MHVSILMIGKHFESTSKQKHCRRSTRVCEKYQKSISPPKSRSLIPARDLLIKNHALNVINIFTLTLKTPFNKKQEIYFLRHLIQFNVYYTLCNFFKWYKTSILDRIREISICKKEKLWLAANGWIEISLFILSYHLVFLHLSRSLSLFLSLLSLSFSLSIYFSLYFFLAQMLPFLVCYRSFYIYYRNNRS